MTNTDELLQAILAGQQKIEKRLEALEQAEPKGAGTIPRPADVPAPTPPHLSWDELDDAAREAWIRAHRGLPGARADTPEWETVQLPGGVGAAFPPPTDEVKAQWKAIAPTIFENWRPEVKEGWLLDIDGCIDAYSESGPLWLSAYAHKFLMQLPAGMRRNMVTQVASYAPVAAAELGRDILRATTSEANTWGYDQALGWGDARLQGVVVMPGPGGASE